MNGEPVALQQPAHDAYRQLCDHHQWAVPDRYNMAVDVADRHDRDATALIFEDHTGTRTRMSWGAVRDRSNRVAARLHALGVRQGDRVAVLLSQRPDTAATYLGVLRTGAVLVTMSPLWADEPIRYRLADSDTSVLVSEAAHTRRTSDFAGITLDVDDPAIAAEDAGFRSVDTAADDPALIFYTSGTTGPAKGIVHAHRTLLGHNEFDVCHDLRPGDVFYGAGEWAWSMAKLMGPLRAGAIQFVYRPAAGFDPIGLLEATARNGVSTALVNPTFLRKLRAAAPDAGRRYPQAFRVVCCANEPLTVDLIDWFRDQFGVTVLDYYGSTESYPLVGNFPGVPVKPGSMGQPLPGWEVAVLDSAGRRVPVGEPGEICLRARSNPQYPLGYWGRPEQSAAVFGGEWYHTNDHATVDEDGYFWFQGRADDVIKTSGYRVGPFEIESALREHPAVAEAGVVGIPDSVRGQAIKAWLRLAPGYQPGETLARQIRDHVKLHHSRFAYPQHIEFISELPKSATGKIRRSALRDRDARTSPASEQTTPEPAQKEVHQ